MYYFSWPLTRPKKLQLAGIATAATFITYGLNLIIWPAPKMTGMPGMGGGDAPPPMWFNLTMWSANFVESIIFGLGLVFALVAFPFFRNLTTHRTLGGWAYAAICWETLTWWPHDQMHRVRKPGDIMALLRIEVGFHITLAIGSVIIAAFVVAMLIQLRSLSSLKKEPVKTAP
ncbi:MAG: hypothetical protein LLG14_20620 [Nocardiaceae bacterium]|nr:hypothetical protein [Nocardiaceae bacterium]